jgi:hypothetical protein
MYTHPQPGGFIPSSAPYIRVNQEPEKKIPHIRVSNSPPKAKPHPNLVKSPTTQTAQPPPDFDLPQIPAPISEQTEIE